MYNYNKQYRNINIYSIKKFENLSDDGVQLDIREGNINDEINFKNL